MQGLFRDALGIDAALATATEMISAL